MKTLVDLITIEMFGFTFSHVITHYSKKVKNKLSINYHPYNSEKN